MVRWTMLVCLFVSLGCAKPSTTSNRSVTTPIYAADALQRYTLEDPGCQESSQPVAITKAPISAWDNDALGNPTASFDGAKTTTSFTTPAISGTTYNDLYVRDCDYTLGQGHYCDDANGTPKGWQGQTEQPLRICQDGHQYARTSYEGVALTSAAFIQRANEHYRALAVAAGAKDPAPIKLLVLPRFTDNYHHFKDENGNDSTVTLHVTHNLAYFPTSQLISVFPETIDQAASEPAYFWESEFVLGHEYGHHIDYTRHGEVLYSIGLKWNPLEHTYDDLKAGDFGVIGPSQRGQLAGALAECFADLMGFYLGGGSAHTLVGLPDIGIDRDVANGTFASADPKILTQEHLDVLYGLAALPDDAKTNYADIHIIGAIIAHTLDAAFADLTAANPAITGDAAAVADARYKLALTFMDAVTPGITALSPDDTGDKVLAPIAAAIEATANGYLSGLSLTDGGDTTKEAICNLARANLPVLSTAPFGKGGGC